MKVEKVMAQEVFKDTLNNLEEIKISELQRIKSVKVNYSALISPLNREWLREHEICLDILLTRLRLNTKHTEDIK